MTRSTKRNKVDMGEPYDDLTAIKGIRATRQQWFRDAMKVRTYQDLAALSIDQIEAGLKAEKQFPSRSMIASWIAQAQVLAETVGAEEQALSRKAAVEAPRWEPFASFVIEFQTLKNEQGADQQRTSIHHIEADKNQLWSGIELREAMGWMLAEAGLSIEAVAAQQAPQAEARVVPANHQGPFSEEMLGVLGKVAQISRSTMPAANSPKAHAPTFEYAAKPPTQPETHVVPANYQGQFSEKMQKVLSKVAQISRSTVPAVNSPKAHVPTFEYAAKPPTQPEARVVPANYQGQFSEKMQAVLARVRQIPLKTD